MDESDDSAPTRPIGPDTLELTTIGVLFLVPGLLAPQIVLTTVGIVVLAAAAIRAGLTLYGARHPLL